MKVAVIICSLDRPAVLGETLRSIFRQTLPPSQVIVSVPDSQSLPSHLRERVTVVYGRLGSSTQRNDGLKAISGQPDLVAFFDDDMELAPDYLELIAAAFRSDSSIAIASGIVVRDGAKEKCEIHRNIARAILYGQRTPNTSMLLPADVSAGAGGYMVVRGDIAMATRFDERLPLYAYLEDRDYTYSCLRHGRIVRVTGARCVHLGANSGGRTHGTKYGYSQIVNPLYLARKWHRSLTTILYPYWFKSVAANLCGIVVRDGIDRLGRLRGNLIAFRDILAHSYAPENVLRL